MRADLTFEIPPGRIASSTSSKRRVADRLPRGEALAQAQERDVAVAVVRRLRQDRQDELREPVAVRLGDRDAVESPRGARGAAPPARATARARRRARRGSRRACPARSEGAPALAGAGGLLGRLGQRGGDRGRRRSPSTPSAASTTPAKTSPAPTVLSDLRGAPGDVLAQVGRAQDRAARAERHDHVARPGGQQRRGGGLGVILAGHHPRLGAVALHEERARHAGARGRARAAAAAPSQRPSRMFASKTIGRPSSSARSRAAVASAASALPARTLDEKNSASAALDGVEQAAACTPGPSRRSSRRAARRTARPARRA